MIKKIIKNKGGLHNRLTQKIHLKPFNLHETELLLKNNRVNLSRYDILQGYMIMGGIPHYLEKIKTGESVAQAVDRLCFRKDGFLRGEFEKYFPYKGVKDSVYRLIDEYSMFYLKYIEKSKPSENDVWVKLAAQQSYKIWSGFSFETICLKHVEQIKEGLKISGVNSVYGSWIQKNAIDGAQIDLLIDRDDNVINLCEMKFYNTGFTIDKKYAADIARKVNAFTASTQTKKSIFVTFITTYGLVKNEYSNQLVQSELTIDHLFTQL